MAGQANQCSDCMIYSVCWNQQYKLLLSSEGILTPASPSHCMPLTGCNWISVWGFQEVFIWALPTMHSSLLITYITNGDKCCIGSWESSVIGGVGEETAEQKKAFYTGCRVCECRKSTTAEVTEHVCFRSAPCFKSSLTLSKTQAGLLLNTPQICDGSDVFHLLCMVKRWVHITNRGAFAKSWSYVLHKKTF